MEPGFLLQYLIDNEAFITCPLLDTSAFISYCVKRGIHTSREELERLEGSGLFYPVARIQRPRIRYKIKYVDDHNSFQILDALQDSEQWSGPVHEEYAHFDFRRTTAREWLAEGLLWSPTQRPFQPWAAFFDPEKQIWKVESFYSIFQSFALYELRQRTRVAGIGAPWWMGLTEDEIRDFVHHVSELSRTAITSLREELPHIGIAVEICQIISNRYYPQTQSDRRTMQLSGYYNTGDWHELRRTWDAKAVLATIGITVEQLERQQREFALTASGIDPMENWYELVSFVAVDQRAQLKDAALLAWTFYSMEHMLRLFYEDLTGIQLNAPDGSPGYSKDQFYGLGVTGNQLKYLESLTNLYHLNPKPSLILVVEGTGEEEQFPPLIERLFGPTVASLGIEMMNLEGVGGFQGRQGKDKYGALEKFIDYHHNKQTIVIAILDQEGRVYHVKEQLLKARSTLNPKRQVTTDANIHVWSKNIEFDNFSDDEIATAMTTLAGGSGSFNSNEIVQCRSSTSGDPLSQLYTQKTGHGLRKPELLEVLFGYIVANGANELDANGEPKRPLVKILKRIRVLASRNHQPFSRDIWEENQKSGVFGDPIP